MSFEELLEPIVHHHQSCIKRVFENASVLLNHEIDIEKVEFQCTCNDVPSIEELNELLEV